MASFSLLAAKLLFLTIAFGVFFAHGFLAPLGRRYPGIKYEPDEYVIQIRNQAVLKDHLAQVRRLVGREAGAEIFKSISINDDFVAYGIRASPAVLSQIRAMDSVIRIEPNAYLELYATQLSPLNWGLDRIDQRNLPLNQKYVYSDKAGEGVDVYIVDTGINLEHVEFANKNAIWGTTTPRNSEDKDLNGHGTHVASTICGVNVGVAKKAKCIAVKVMKDSGLGTVFDITAGLSWVSEQHQNGTRKSVVNMSLGSPISNPIIDASVAALVRSGVVTVVAAGNSDRNACLGSPAGQDDMIVVGASDSNDVRAYFSNWGTCVDFFAPGVNITAAWFDSNDGYFVASGTSMASPHGAGVAALVLSEQGYGFGQEEARSEITRLATSGVLSDIKEGSPNLLLFNNPPAARV